MREQLLNRDRLPCLRHFGNVLDYRILYAQFLLAFQLEDCQRGE